MLTFLPLKASLLQDFKAMHPHYSEGFKFLMTKDVIAISTDLPLICKKRNNGKHIMVSIQYLQKVHFTCRKERNNLYEPREHHLTQMRVYFMSHNYGKMN
jgi:hypothetical protein